MQLSPLNFRGLLHTMNIVGEPESPDQTRHSRRRAIECWRCPECLDIHDYEDEAEECCNDADAKAPSAPACPVCAQKYATHRDASDCCIWKDLSAQQRWQIADAVEAGGSWADQLLTPNTQLKGGPGNGGGA